MQKLTDQETQNVQTITAAALQPHDIEVVESALAKIPDTSELVVQLQAIVRSVRNGLDISVLTQDKELTPNEAASLLQVSRPHVMSLIKRGELVSHLVGRDHRIPQSEVMDLLRRKAEASRDVAAAFAKRDATKRALIARGAGVDPAIAQELGY